MRSQNGFTLLEIIVAIFIIAIFTVLPILAYSSYQKKARDEKRKADVGKISQALESYKAEKGTYPPNLDTLVTEGYLPEIPKDPLQGQQQVSWDEDIAYGYSFESADGTSYTLSTPLELGGASGTSGSGGESPGGSGGGSVYVVTPQNPGGKVIPVASLTAAAGFSPTPQPPTKTPFLTQPPLGTITSTPTPSNTPTNTPTRTPTPLLPDLYVQSITRDATNYTVTYCNNGPGTSANTMTIQLERLSSPNPIGAGWSRTGGKAVPGVGQCAQHLVSRCTFGESGGGCSDTINVRATVNYYAFDGVSETNMANNTLDQAFNAPSATPTTAPTATPVCQNYMACSTNAQCGNGTCYASGFCACTGFTPPSPGKILFTSAHVAPSYPTSGYDKDCDYETFEMSYNGTSTVQVTNACTNNLSNAIGASYSADRTCVVYTGVVQSSYGPPTESIYVTNAPGKTCSVSSGFKSGGSYNCGPDCYPDYYRHPVFSKDKSLIYFSRNYLTNFINGSPVFTGYQIVAINSSTGALVSTLTSSGDNIYPVVSPDGTKIAYTSTSSGNSEVWIMNVDGTGKTQLTNSAALPNFYQKGNSQPSFTANGSKIVFLTNRDKTSSPDYADVYIMNVNGSSPAVVANYNRYKVGASANAHGSDIVIFEQSAIYTVYPDGTGLTQVFPSGKTPNSYTGYGNAHGLSSYK